MHNKGQVLIAISKGVRVVENHLYQTHIPNFQKQNNNITHLTKKITNTLLSSIMLKLMVQILEPVCLYSDLGLP